MEQAILAPDITTIIQTSDDTRLLNMLVIDQNPLVLDAIYPGYGLSALSDELSKRPRKNEELRELFEEKEIRQQYLETGKLSPDSKLAIINELKRRNSTKDVLSMQEALHNHFSKAENDHTRRTNAFYILGGLSYVVGFVGVIATGGALIPLIGTALAPSFASFCSLYESRAKNIEGIHKHNAERRLKIMSKIAEDAGLVNHIISSRI